MASMDHNFQTMKARNSFRRTEPPEQLPPAIPVPEKRKSVDKQTQRSEKFDRRYDSTQHGEEDFRESRLSSFVVDPWESRDETTSRHGMSEREERFTNSDSESVGEMFVDEDEDYIIYEPESDRKSTFLMPCDIHPQMEHKEEEIDQLRLLAGTISAGWGSAGFMAPALARRIRDFQFAQEKRRKKYGDERPFGILGLYDHLSSIRIDVEWAEDAALRRANGDPYFSWADFEESKKGSANRPWFTYTLLFVCTILMIASIGVNGWKVENLSENPMIGPSAMTLIKMGAKDTDLIVNENEGWRLLTSTILHAGLVHYFINVMALWFVGAAIESTHGWVAAMIIFTLSAVGGTILSAIFLPEYITVGASGGIFGFIGACLADIIMNWKLLFCDFVTENGKKHHHAMVVVALLFDIALNSIIGLTPFVDNFTHLGGMLFGFMCGLSTIQRLSADFFGMEEDWLTQTKHFLMKFCGLILTTVSLIIILAILLQSEGNGQSTPCPGCTWLSCVPFPPWESEASKWWYCDDCGRVTAELVTSGDTFKLELDCPNGSVADIDLSAETSINRDRLQRKLPSYCREYCSMPQDELEKDPMN